jgi:hypothetical protein
MHTHIYIHFHTSHISHIRANTRHELLTADFASPHTADGPAYPSRPAADHLHLQYGLCARQHNQSQPSLRTHALSGTPDGAFCRRVRHPPPAHSSPAPCTCPPKPPAPLSPPNDRTPGRAPAAGSLSHGLRGHKTACAETVSRRPCCHTRTPHPNTSMRHRSRPPLRPAPTPQPSPPQKLSGEASAVPIAPVAPGSQLQPALSDSARDAAATKMDIICGPLLAHPHPPAHQPGIRTVSSDAQTGTLPRNSGAGRQTRGQCSYPCSCSQRQRPRLPTTVSSGPKPVLRSRNHQARPRHDVRGTHTMAGAHPAAVGGRSMPHVPMPRLYTAQEPATAAGGGGHFSTKVAG